MYTILGITAFGVLCGEAGVPTAFTRVSAYREWIEQHVWPDEGEFIYIPMTYTQFYLLLFADIDDSSDGIEPYLCEDKASIDGKLFCDGVMDCPDGSDEKLFCKRFPCRSGYVRCDYGACVRDTSICGAINETFVLRSKQHRTMPQLYSKSEHDDTKPYECEDHTTIDSSLLCNGVEDCPDGSDEKTFCQFLPCPTGFERCGNGPCVRNTSECIANKQNVDSEGCRVERTPKNGFVALASNVAKHLEANAIVANNRIIQYGCDAGYHLIGANSVVFCVNGKWSGEDATPTCERRCNMTEISSITYMTNCYESTDPDKKEVRCTAADLVVPGVVVQIACRSGYRNVQPNSRQITCDHNGQWNNYPKPCQQVCGEEGPAVDGYIHSGVVTMNHQVPWHVAIYHIANDTRIDQVPTYICGGSIINARMVISAIHCFWDAAFEVVAPASEYRVVAGKFYSGYNDPREKNKFQVLHIRDIAYPDGYNDYTGLYANDIAILVLDKYIEFRRNIAPVCVNLHYQFEERVITPGLWGRVPGWGVTKIGGDISDELKSIEIPVVNRTECRAHLDRATRPFLTAEKFCAGILNQNAGVCHGDSGGGLVFQEDVDEQKFYHLRGIVSSGPRDGNSCDANKYAFFTNIAHFSQFIERYDLITNPSHGLDKNKSST